MDVLEFRLFTRIHQDGNEENYMLTIDILIIRRYQKNSYFYVYFKTNFAVKSVKGLFHERRTKNKESTRKVKLS